MSKKLDLKWCSWDREQAFGQGRQQCPPSPLLSKVEVMVEMVVTVVVVVVLVVVLEDW